VYVWADSWSTNQILIILQPLSLRISMLIELWRRFLLVSYEASGNDWCLIRNEQHKDQYRIRWCGERDRERERTRTQRAGQKEHKQRWLHPRWTASHSDSPHRCFLHHRCNVASLMSLVQQSLQKTFPWELSWMIRIGSSESSRFPPTVAVKFRQRKEQQYCSCFKGESQSLLLMSIDWSPSHKGKEF
jgi:hypothetical protein